MKIVKKNFIIERGDAYLGEDRVEIRVPGDWTSYKCSWGVKLEKRTPSSNLLIRKRNTLYNGSDDELEAIYDGSDTCFKISIQKEDAGDFLEPKYYFDLIAIDPLNSAKTKTLAKGEFKVEFDTQTEFDNTQLPTDAERYIAVLASAFDEDTLVYKTGTTFAQTEFTATEIASAISQSHVHENIEVIDATTASFTTELLEQLQATLSSTEIAELLTNYYTADEVDDFLSDKINTTEIGLSIASLVDGKVPITQLPTNLLDDYVEYANYAALPVTGETDLLYITINDNKLFRWTGSLYVEVSPSHTHSNKAILDDIDVAFTSTLKTGYDGAVTASHGHSNKTVLDNIDVAFTTSLKTNYDAAYNALHSHTNKANLDTINQALATTSVVAFSTVSIGNATLGANALAVNGASIFNGRVVGVINSDDYALSIDNSNAAGYGFRIRQTAHSNVSYRLFSAQNSTGSVFTILGNGFVGVNYTADPTSGNTLAVNGSSYFGSVRTAGFTAVGLGQIAGFLFSPAQAGASVEMGWNSTYGLIQAYNRTTSAYQPMKMDGSTIALQISGSSALSIDASKNVVFSGAGNFIGSITVSKVGTTASAIISSTTSGNSNIAFQDGGTINKAIIGWDRTLNVFRISTENLGNAFTLNMSGEATFINNANVVGSGLFKGTSLKVTNTAGSALNIGTNEAAGSVGSPLYIGINFLGYADNVKARIRAFDISANQSYGGLTISTRNSAGTLVDNITIDGSTGNATIAGSILVSANNSFDIGASATKFRTGFFGTSIINDGFLEVGSYIKQTAIAATSAVNNSTFIDSADNKLKFKDNFGTVKEIAFV